MAEDQTSEETLIEETSKETAGEESVQGETQKQTEPEVDYKKKFIGSQREAIRLKKENESLKTQPSTSKEVPQDSEIESLIDRKVQEKIAPLKEQQAKDMVDSWFSQNPEAIDYLGQIEETYSAAPGKTITEKLENAYLIAKKEAMKEAGKKEMAFAIYQKGQAVAGGGGVSTSMPESSLPLLTAEEKQVAQKMGVSEEAYAKRKLESGIKK